MKQKPGQPEHYIQAAFVSRCVLHEKRYPALKLAFAVPNGQLRNVVVARKLKAEGQRNAVNDWILPVPNKHFAGLAIEFKAPGRYPTPEQRKYHALLKACGWCVLVHRDPEEAWQAVRAYVADLTPDMLANIVAVEA